MTTVHRVHVLPWLRRPAQRLIMPNWLAITIFREIFAWRQLDEAELAHEVKHVEQWSRHGVRFVYRYWRASTAAAKAGLDRYRDNEFEREALSAEHETRARLLARSGPM